MIDLHTHSIFSDGDLLPSELVRRAIVYGYEVIAITDHVDYTNIETVLRGVKEAKYLEEEWDVHVIVGVEITHVPQNKIQSLALKARALGAEIVLVHGETLIEPVAPGTNRAALGSDIDILAHPGLITLEEAELARDNNISLEITSRYGHNIANGHVARIAQEVKAGLIFNTDAHSPEDLITRENALKVALGAGLEEKQAREIVESKPLNLVEKLI